MSRVGAIALREFRSYFLQPIGWVLVALFLALSGFVFALEIYRPAEPASMRTFFISTVWMLTVVAPAITMRLVSSELRMGTIETLMTSPVRDWEIIGGKFVAAVGVLLVMLAPTLSYVVLLAMVSTPDYGPILLGYAGVLLLGMTALSTGVLTSTATQSQMAAYLSAFFFWLIVGVIGARGAAALGPPWDEYLYVCLPRRHMANLARGAFHLADIVYFLSLTLVFLALAVKLLESRRWR